MGEGVMRRESVGAGSAGGLKGEESGMTHLLIVIVICSCSAVIVAASTYYCYRWDRSISRRKGEEKGVEKEPLLKGYGAVVGVTAAAAKSPLPSTDMLVKDKEKVVRIRGTL